MAPASLPERCPNPAPRQLIRATAAQGEQPWSWACPAHSSPHARRVCPAACPAVRLRERFRCGVAQLAPCTHRGCRGWWCCCWSPRCRPVIPRHRPAPRPCGKCGSEASQGVATDLRDVRSVEAGAAEGAVERFASSSSACLKVLWVAGNLKRCHVHCGGLLQ